MKTVAQEHSMGCGIACVAYITRKKYKDVLNLFEEEYVETGGYYCRDLINALNILGIKYSYKKVVEKTKNLTRKEKSIIFIRRSKKYPEGHYIVKTKNGWMNPWINFPESNPIKSGFNKRLPGQAQWVLYRG